MRKRARLFLMLLVVSLVLPGLSGCSLLAHSSANTSSRSSQPSRPLYHVVRKGETLYSIAWNYGKDYRSMAVWNDIDYPYLIKPGQYIYLRPRPAGSKLSASSQSRYSAGGGPRHSSKTTRKIAKARDKPVARPKQKAQKKRVLNRAPKWRWPTHGKVIEKYSFGRGKKGIVIKGRSGQKITAAAAGQVVYTGSGLQGYGKLIIIKHNDTFLSAYANNKKIRVKEREKVKQGQHIADMGKSGTKISALHFEIRRNGKPVNPLRYLPKQ